MTELGREVIQKESTSYPQTFIKIFTELSTGACGTQLFLKCEFWEKLRTKKKRISVSTQYFRKIMQIDISTFFPINNLFFIFNSMTISMILYFFFESVLFLSNPFFSFYFCCADNIFPQISFISFICLISNLSISKFAAIHIFLIMNPTHSLQSLSKSPAGFDKMNTS